MRLTRALPLLLVLDAIRLAIHFALYHDRVALYQIGALDGAALLLAAIASVLGPLVGEAFASITLFFVAVGLPFVFFGWLFDKVGQHTLSRLMMPAGLCGVGAGLAISTAQRRVLALFGAALVAGGLYGLISIQEQREAILIAAPAALSCAVYIVTGFKRPRG